MGRLRPHVVVRLGFPGNAKAQSFIETARVDIDLQHAQVDGTAAGDDIFDEGRPNPLTLVLGNDLDLVYEYRTLAFRDSQKADCKTVHNHHLRRGVIVALTKTPLLELLVPSPYLLDVWPYGLSLDSVERVPVARRRLSYFELLHPCLRRPLRCCVLS